MQRFWDGLLRLFAAGLLGAVVLLNTLPADSGWRPAVWIISLVCSVGLALALYFSRRPHGTDESYGSDAGEDRLGSHHDQSDD